jgi:hypothetical protein
MTATVHGSHVGTGESGRMWRCGGGSTLVEGCACGKRLVAWSWEEGVGSWRRL